MASIKDYERTFAFKKINDTDLSAVNGGLDVDQTFIGSPLNLADLRLFNVVSDSYRASSSHALFPIIFMSFVMASSLTLYATEYTK